MKKTAIILVCMLLLSLMTGCGAGGNKKVDSINISYVKLPLNVPSIIEKNEMMFEEEFEKDGIKVAFPEITQGSKMTEAMAAGSLDFCNALGGTSAILAATNGVDLKIIGIYSRAPKAFTIMSVNPAIQSIDDLKNKKIAGPKGTILHQLLLAALKEKKLAIDDVSFINMGIPESVSALLTGNVDVALVAGPTVTKALAEGAHIISTGEGLLDATIVIAVRGGFLDNHPELVDRYLRVHARSLEFMKNNPEETMLMAAQETGLSLEEVKTMYAWYDFNPGITQADIKELENTQKFLVENDMLTKIIDIQDIIR